MNYRRLFDSQTMRIITDALINIGLRTAFYRVLRKGW